MSVRKTSAHTRKAKSRANSADNRAPLPNLDNVVDALVDATALVSVASDSIMRRGGGPEATVLRLGVIALERVMDQLEEIEVQFHVFRKRNGMVEGGKP
jgi:hypothetical protein